jgi:hypothetical protein
MHEQAAAPVGVVAAVAVVIAWALLAGPLRWSSAGVYLRCAVGDDVACLVYALDEEIGPGSSPEETAPPPVDDEMESERVPPPVDDEMESERVPVEDPAARTAEDACEHAEVLEIDADALANSTDEAGPSDRQWLLDAARESRDRAAELGYPCR